MLYMAKSPFTEQLNLRMSKEFLEDVDAISKILRVNKSEWIKIKLGEIVYTEKSRLLGKMIDLKNKDIVDKKAINKLTK